MSQDQQQSGESRQRRAGVEDEQRPGHDRRALHIVLLDARWHPAARLTIDGGWPEIMAWLMRHDSRWIAVEQQRLPHDPVRPGPRDIAFTRALHRWMRPLGMVLADHVIQAGDSRFSFRTAGLL